MGWKILSRYRQKRYLQWLTMSVRVVAKDQRGLSMHKAHPVLLNNYTHAFKSLTSIKHHYIYGAASLSRSDDCVVSWHSRYSIASNGMYLPQHFSIPPSLFCVTCKRNLKTWGA